MAINYYRLLGVPPDAGQRRIKSAYRSLAKRFHPDRNSGSETVAELFRQANHAYRILSDPKLRELYDKKLAKQENLNNQPAATGTTTVRDPQQKFNRFVKSLLDALFGSIDSPSEPPRQVRQPKTKTIKAAKPAFNIHYNMAMGKNKTSYVRGKDGVFRKTPPQQT